MLDKNSNVTRLEQGPQVFVRKDHELVTGAREKFIIIPPRHYCIIENPVERNEVTVDDGPPQAKRVKSSSSMVLLLLRRTTIVVVIDTGSFLNPFLS